MTDKKLIEFMELVELHGFTYSIHAFMHLLENDIEHKAFINYWKAHTRARNYYNRLVKKANNDKL